MDILDAMFDLCYSKTIHLGSGVFLWISYPLDRAYAPYFISNNWEVIEILVI